MNGKIDYASIIEKDRVHASVYTQDAIFSDEMERIFHEGWVFVGHQSEVPNTGSYVRRQLGRQPVLLVRDAAGGLQVLLNRCAHRGNMLCWKNAGNTRKSITCSYHGWTYALTGELLGVPHPGGSPEVKKRVRLAKAAAVEEYRGFVFASLKPPKNTLDEHLGNGKLLIDRTCNLSPAGEIEIRAGWLKHKVQGNWKMLTDNSTDGYHIGFVHSSFLEALNTNYVTAVAPREDQVLGFTRAWGGGHIELEFAPTYKKPLDWIGGKLENYRQYIAAMTARFGEKEANARIFDGPSHAMIFPNLFLGEMNLQIVEPVSASKVVMNTSPLFLKDAPEVNARVLKQTPGTFGPASFLLSDDATTAERNQIGLSARQPEWVDISRGIQREEAHDLYRQGHLTDEVGTRGFWRHYAHLMTNGA